MEGLLAVQHACECGAPGVVALFSRMTSSC